MELFVFGETWDVVRSIIEELRLSIMFFFCYGEKFETNAQPQFWGIFHNYRLKEADCSIVRSWILNLELNLKYAIQIQLDFILYLDAIEFNLYLCDTYLLTYHPNGKTPFAFPAEEEAVVVLSR